MSKRGFRTARDHHPADPDDRSHKVVRRRSEAFKTIAKRRRQSLEGRDFSDTANIIRRYRDGTPP